MTQEKSMLAYSSKWYGEGSFRLLPVNENCPFLEGIFDPSTKVLAIIGKSIKEKPQMMPKINAKGQTITVKNIDGVSGLAEERVIMDTYYEYYIDDEEDIKDFIKMFVINLDNKCLKILDTIFKTENNK